MSLSGSAVYRKGNGVMTRGLVVRIGLFLCLTVSLMSARPSFALTPACTQITNTAVLAYSVGGIAQTPASGSVTFTVGNKVDVLVTAVDAGFVIAPPGSLATAMTFSVMNNGNATQKYDITWIAEPNGTVLFGGTDNFDAANVKIYVGGVQTTTIPSLASGASQSVRIVADIPLMQHDTDVTVYALKAQTGNIDNSALAEGSGQTIVGGVAACTGDVVFGDAAGTDDVSHDAAHSTRDAIKVIAASLTVTKAASSIYDPINCSSLSPITCSGAPKIIPGALVEYTITISNSASGTATNMAITDTLDANLTFYSDGYAAGKGMQMTVPNMYGGNPTALTNAADADEGTYDAGTKTVTVNNVIVQQNQTALVKFRAFIK